VNQGLLSVAYQLKIPPMVRRPTIAPETSGTRIQIAASVAERSVLMYLTGGAELMRVSVGIFPISQEIIVSGLNINQQLRIF
jgi:hypothetical protein